MLIEGLPESLIAKTRFVNDRSQKMTLRRFDEWWNTRSILARR